MTDLRYSGMERISYESETNAAANPARGFAARLAGLPPGSPQRALLQRAIEFEVVPRLVLSHAVKGQSQITAAGGLHTSRATDEIKAFADLILGPDESRAAAHIQTLRDRQVPLERVYLDLLVPTARHLRQAWLDDERDFADVSLGLWRLQQLLREYSSAFRKDNQPAMGFRALLTPGPGETQDLGYLMFGLVLLGEFFRRDGWDTWIEPDPANKSFTELVSSEWFDVVEFLVSGERRLDALASSIQKVRDESLNRALGVVVCGQMFIEHPELVLKVGGDSCAADPRQGVSQAQNLVGLTAKRA